MGSQNPPFIVNSFLTDKGATVSFSGFSSTDVANIMQDFFISCGFHLESGTPTQGTYTKGNSGGRAILGGFVERMKYSVQVWTDQNNVHAKTESTMSGISGSVLGVVRERKGRDEMKKLFENFLLRFPRQR